MQTVAFAFWVLLRRPDSPRRLCCDELQHHLSWCDETGAQGSCLICFRRTVSTCYHLFMQRRRIVWCQLVCCEGLFQVSEAFCWRDCVCLPGHGSGGEQLLYCQDQEGQLPKLVHWPVAQVHYSQQAVWHVSLALGRYTQIQNALRWIHMDYISNSNYSPQTSYLWTVWKSPYIQRPYHTWFITFLWSFRYCIGLFLNIIYSTKSISTSPPRLIV